MDSSKVDNQNVNNQNVDNTNVDNQKVDDTNVDNQNVNNQNMDDTNTDFMERVDDFFWHVWRSGVSGMVVYFIITRGFGRKELTYCVEPVVDQERKMKYLLAFSGYVFTVPVLLIWRSFRDGYRWLRKYREGYRMLQNNIDGRLMELKSGCHAMTFGMRQTLRKNYIRSFFFPIYGPLSFSLWVIDNIKSVRNS